MPRLRTPWQPLQYLEHRTPAGRRRLRSNLAMTVISSVAGLKPGLVIVWVQTKLACSPGKRCTRVVLERGARSLAKRAATAQLLDRRGPKSWPFGRPAFKTAGGPGGWAPGRPRHRHTGASPSAVVDSLLCACGQGIGLRAVVWRGYILRSESLKEAVVQKEFP